MENTEITWNRQSNPRIDDDKSRASRNHPPQVNPTPAASWLPYLSKYIYLLFAEARAWGWGLDIQRSRNICFRIDLIWIFDV